MESYLFLKSRLKMVHTCGVECMKLGGKTIRCFETQKTELSTGHNIKIIQVKYN